MTIAESLWRKIAGPDEEVQFQAAKDRAVIMRVCHALRIFSITRLRRVKSLPNGTDVWEVV